MFTWIARISLILLTLCLQSNAAEDFSDIDSKVQSTEIIENLIHLEEAEFDLREYGRPFWFSAAKLGYIDVISFLMHRYIELNSKNDNDGNKTALHLAAEYGQIDIVQLLLKEGADVDCNDNLNKITPLILAATKGRSEIVSILIGYNADFSKNKFALHQASKMGHLETVKVLLSAGFDVNAEDRCHNRALHHAAENGHTDIVIILIQAGADIDIKYDDRTALQLAAINGHYKIAQALLEAGAKMNNLHKAAFLGDTNTLKSLISLDPKLIRYTDKDMSAMHYAACADQTKTVEFLINAHVSIEGEYNNSITPLQLASRNGHINTVKTLLKAGANTNAICSCNCNHGHFSALFLAAGNGHTETIKLLLNAGAKINQESRDFGRLFIKDSCIDNFCWITALHYACYNGHIESVKILLEAEAYVNAIDNGWSPLHQAAEKGHNEIVQTLLESGADINAVEWDHKWTPLHLVAKNGFLETVQILISFGADISAIDKNGDLASLLATENGYLQIEKYLNSISYENISN